MAPDTVGYCVSTVFPENSSLKKWLKQEEKDQPYKTGL